MKWFGLTATKLFHFYRIFKNRGGKGVPANSLNPLWIRHCATFTSVLEFNPNHQIYLGSFWPLSLSPKTKTFVWISSHLPIFVILTLDPFGPPSWSLSFSPQTKTFVWISSHLPIFVILTLDPFGPPSWSLSFSPQTKTCVWISFLIFPSLSYWP